MSIPASNRSLLWLFSFSMCCLVFFVLYWEITHQYAYLAPDSFTYFAMARHWKESGAWFSYSGLDKTTGIHLGYYLLLLPFTWLAGWHLPAWSFVINAACLALGLWLTKRALGWQVPLIMALGILTPYGVSVVHSGLESSLAWLMICVAMYAVRDSWADPRPSKRKILYSGLALGGLMVGRLDLVFLVFASSLILTIRWWHLRRPRMFLELKSFLTDLLYLGLPIVAIGAAIGAVNYTVGGSLIPISGQLKSSFPVPTDTPWQHLWGLKLFLAAVLVIGARLVVQWRSRREVDCWHLAIWLACLGLWLYNGLFASGVGAWYGVLPLYGLLLVVGQSIKTWLDVHRAFANNRWIPMSQVIGPLVICLLIATWHVMLRRVDWITPHREAARFMQTYAKPGEAGGEFKDGIFAYYSTMPIFNMTGLANNHAYVVAARQNTYRQYFQERSIQYIVSGSWASGLQVPRAAPMFKTCGNAIFDNDVVKIFAVKDCVFTDR